MKRIFIFIALLVSASQLFAATPTTPTEIQVYFSPAGGCTDAIVKELNKATKTVLIQAYSFTSKPIAEAAVKAKRRGVAVTAILDRSQKTERYSEADFLAHAGIKTLIDDRHQIAHNKVIIVDSEVVITGSFNFSKAAETSNAENLLVIRSKELAVKYERNWREHEKHSEDYSER